MPEPFDGAAARRLVDELTDDLDVRYAGDDDPDDGHDYASQVGVADFTPPAGVFLVAYEGEEPVGCGGLRRHADGVGEVKRMYVVPGARGRGVARALLDALEGAARAAGYRWVRLETGLRQPEAIALYRSSGYEDIPSYGYYRDSPLSVCLEKRLDTFRGRGDAVRATGQS
jgi:GNAT superfamily N-acetyltransferase